jgi:undecaprenyl-diphosphatase
MSAVLLYFRRDLIRIVEGWLRSLRRPELRGELDARLGWCLIIATVPIGIFGVAFRDQIESGARNLELIASALIVVGFMLLVAERVATRKRDLERIDTGDGATIGLAQALALVPGVSRSGATIAAGLFRGLDRVSAARFSFLLSVPAVVLSGLFELKNIVGGSEHQEAGALALVVATGLAFVVGYLSIAFLLRFLVSHTTKVFVAYRVTLGMLVLALAIPGVID